MCSSLDIPEIEITHEADSDNDNDIDYMNLSEVLTDVEDLYDDAVQTNHVLRDNKQNKLKIRLDRDSCLTDLEDFEASDNEDDGKSFIIHKNPISIDDLDLEFGVVEESYDVGNKSTRGKNKLKSQVSLSHQNQYKSEDIKVSENFTDEEDFESDNVIESYEIPFDDIDLDAYCIDQVNVSEQMNGTPQNNDESPSISGVTTPDPKPNNQFLINIQSVSPRLTDLEVLNSNSDDEKPILKSKARRRRHRSGRKKPVADLEISDKAVKNKTSCAKSKNNNRSHINHSALSYDSDNEGDNPLPFPLCKKIAEKVQNNLNIPEFDTNFHTDTEDLEDDFADAVETFEPPDADLEAKLDEMASFYCEISESNNLQSPSELNSDSEKNYTDINNCEANNKKISEKKKKHTEKRKPTQTLTVQSPNMEDITDCEKLDSSEEESEQNPTSPTEKSVTSTDEEDFEVDTYSTTELPEVELPQPVRNIMILRQNESLPTVQILPLADDYTLKFENHDSEEVMTDEERVSEMEEGTDVDNQAVGMDTYLPDCGLVDVVENMQKHLKITKTPKDITETLTDTEEIFLDETRKRRRAPKLKYMHEKFIANRNHLDVNQNQGNGHTDTEDIFMSDGASDNPMSLSPLLNITQGATDVEYLGDSTDDEKCNAPQIRPLSCTPQHLREMEGEMFLAKEGSGPISLLGEAILKKNIRNIGSLATPTLTDSEDMLTSADEDVFGLSRAETATPSQIHSELEQVSASKVYTETSRKFDDEGVMYLKGGGYSERHTDVEELYEDEYIFEDVSIPNKSFDSILLQSQRKVSLNVVNNTKGTSGGNLYIIKCFLILVHIIWY